MTFSSSLAFFDHLMNEGDLDEAAFLAFMQARTSDEGLYLDFKSGLELDKPKDKRNFTVKQYVGAFANSEGGVLIIGVKDQTADEKRRRQPKVLAPITTQQETGVGGDLARWAKDCVADLIGYLGVPPRLKVIDVTGGKVLLVAVPRAPSLVPVIKEGKQAYYFRVEDEAREVYPHLVSDLVLGRRQTPLVEISETEGTAASRDGDLVFLHLALGFLNDSLLLARNVRVGLVAHYRPDHLETNTEFYHNGLSRALRERIEVLDSPMVGATPTDVSFRWARGRRREAGKRSRDLAPFETKVASAPNWFLPLDVGSDVLAAIYVLPEGAEPRWFQLTVRRQAIGRIEDGASYRNIDIDIQPISGARPKVGLVPLVGT